MSIKGYEYQSDFAKKYVAKGREEGTEGKAEAFLTILRARGLVVTEDERSRILAVGDPAVLDRLLAGALDAASVSDLLGR